MQETRNRLLTIASYRRQFDRVTKAVVTADGIAQFRFEPGLGYPLAVDLAEVPGGDENTTLFRSTGGNLEVAGMIEFFQVRENLTEVVLTIDYQLKAPLARVVDALGHVLDRFLNEQLHRMQAHFEGVGTIASAHHEMPMQSHFLQPAA